jgi:ParB-like chromosome segregation protein Spo0J
VDTISVHDLILDRSLNPRLGGVDQEVVAFYATIFHDVHWPPILVDRATHKLIDGWHRVEAAKRVGVYTLPVQWLEVPTDEHFALAVKANLAHGIRLSKEDRLQAIEHLIREGWTPERIANALGCSIGQVDKTEKATDLRAHFKVNEHPGAKLPLETLTEIIRLPREYQEEIAEMACDVEAAPADVRRAVRAIKKDVVESNEEIRRVMTDPEFGKARLKAKDADTGQWLLTFATLVDQIETNGFTLSPDERDAAISLFARLRDWTNRQLKLIAPEM